jgi:hypothetical protein
MSSISCVTANSQYLTQTSIECWILCVRGGRDHAFERLLEPAIARITGCQITQEIGLKLDIRKRFAYIEPCLISSCWHIAKSMPAKRLQRLATLYLAALYGAVGLTGGSLHYLATDWDGFWFRSDSVETVVYFHVHAPDHHGHFHRHAVDAHHHHHAHAKIAADRGAKQPKGPTAESSDGQTHQQHACPLLSLVSTLKLLDAGECSSPIVLDSIGTPTYQPGLLYVPDVVLNSPARGPPSDYLT